MPLPSKDEGHDLFASYEMGKHTILAAMATCFLAHSGTKLVAFALGMISHTPFLQSRPSLQQVIKN